MKLCRSFGLLFCLIVATLLVATSFAQETTAGIQGYVKDQTGAVVAKAVVQISGPALIGIKKVETDSAGFYRVSNLPPGDYTLSVTASGFRGYRQTGIALSVGKLPNLDISLQVGTVAEAIEVTGAAPIVDVTQSKVSTDITHEIMSTIPKGRSFESLITLAPGARQEPLSSQAQGSMGFQINGATDSENTYLVEGMDTTGIQGGGIGMRVPTEFIQEVQIKSSGFEAEHGGALGGVVNIVQNRGSNTWHGNFVTTYRSDAFDASAHSTLRLDPQGSTSVGGRLGQEAQYYVGKEDQRRIVEPGFDVGGYAVKDRLWVYAGYEPQFDRLTRTVNFIGPNPGPWTFTRSLDWHYGMTRIDAALTNKIRLFGSWQYAFQKQVGSGCDLGVMYDPDALPTRDSVTGQYNTASTIDPAAYRRDTGCVKPNSVFNFGGDVSATSKFVLSARYGYWFNNYRDKGLPNGPRYMFDLTQGSIGVVGLDGTPVAAQYQFGNNWYNIPSNNWYVYDAYKRKGLTTDASYFATVLGTHAFKFGYGFNNLSNSALHEYRTGRVRLGWNSEYEALTDTGVSNCNAIDAANGGNGCRGNYGFYTIMDLSLRGDVSSYNHHLYAQDAWTLGKGLTLNLGLRFDSERLPSYAAGLPGIKFGFADKMAPRLGAAWDVFRNGKLKVFGSFGLFYDIMKYELPRGSFGGDYWHDCNYTLDVPNGNFYDIVPSKSSTGTTCPGAGAYPGTFIEEVDWRIPSNAPPPEGYTAEEWGGIAPGLKPMRQRQTVLGGEWAMKPDVALEVRYSRNRLDRTIEDVGVLTNLGEAYWIANPGEGIVKNTLANDCPECPNSPKAIRNYDGVEFRLTKRQTSRWQGSVSYTYSRLWGNYGGLSSADELGRHSPNVNRYFDLPHMVFDSHGKQAMGLLATDRPHSLSMYGSFNQKWLGMESRFGFSQAVYSGSPLTTTMWVVSSTHTYVEGRNAWVNLNFDPNTGYIGIDSIGQRRMPVFTQSNFFFGHDFGLSKTNEALKLGFEFNVENLFNEANVLHIDDTPARTSGSANRITPRIDGAVDWLALTKTGYDWVGLWNATPHAFDQQYGKADLFQRPRTMYVKLKLSF